MKFESSSAPFIAGPNSVSALMRRVIMALLPGAIIMTWFFGWGVVINLLIASAAALGSEALILTLRNRPIAPANGTGLNDGSALLTGLLIGLSLPPLVGWWIPVIAAGFAIIMAKQLYGGLGFNPFNPAMAGFVVVLISFPKDMTQWLSLTEHVNAHPDLLGSLAYVFKWSANIEATGLDAITQATPLDYLKTELSLGHTVEEIIIDPSFGAFGGTGWQLINLGFLLGGLWMIKRGDIDWRIPLSMLLSLSVMAIIFKALDPDLYRGPLFHLFSGATMLGAMFIATDPISAATSPRGRIYYGIGIGIFIFIIRTWAGYPDAIAFAVLLMNITAPTLDYYTQPRVYGETDAHGHLRGESHDSNPENKE